MSLVTTYHISQALLCGYTGYQSYQAIWRLQQYESQSETAAKWSTVAADQLHTTRTTQASGAITTFLSLLTSLYLATPFLSSSPLVSLILSIINAITLSLAYNHISSFWQTKAKVPMVKDYNDAIAISNVMRQYLIVLALTWWVAMVWYFSGVVGVV